MENVTNAKIDQYIEEFFPMKKGEMIKHPQETFLFAADIQISRRALKHIVERRSINDGRGIDGLKLLMKSACEAVTHPQIIIKNSNGRYSSSRLFGRFDPKTNKGIMVVVDSTAGVGSFVVTIFYKEAVQFFKLQEKK